jgi:hypothetical protein
MYYHCIVFFDVQNLVLCLTRGLIQSMTLGFGTYKPFRPVLMRTLLARMHIHWPESKFTKSNINSKKVMKSITSITISRLFSWIKKYMSLFGAPPVRSPHPHHSTSLSLLSYTGTCKIITFKPWSYTSETGQNAPTFFQNKFFFPKRPQHCLPKWYA